MVPKVPPLSGDLHPDLQLIDSPPLCSEWNGTSHAQSLSPTLNAITQSAKRARRHCQPSVSENTGMSVDAKDDADGFVNPPGVQWAPRPKGEASKHASRSPCPPSWVGPCFQTLISILPSAAPISERVPSAPPLGDLMHAVLNPSEEELKRIDSMVKFVAWISKSNFLRSQQPEPIIGYPSHPLDCARTAEAWGIKGQSVYTALFDHTDFEIFSCKLCPHRVDDLDVAITHQRDHFGHCPFQCSGAQVQWCVSFFSLV